MYCTFFLVRQADIVLDYRGNTIEFGTSAVKCLTSDGFPFTVTTCERFLLEVNVISGRGDNQEWNRR